MITTCSCQFCEGHLEFETDEIPPGTKIICPKCQAETQLYIPEKPAEPIKTAKILKADYDPEPRFTEKPPTNAQKYLEKLRKDSCYEFLRMMIDVCFGISLFGILIAVCVTFSQYADDGPAVAVAALVSVPILIAGRQSALLLIDLTDSTLNEHAKKP